MLTEFTTLIFFGWLCSGDFIALALCRDKDSPANLCFGLVGKRQITEVFCSESRSREKRTRTLWEKCQYLAFEIDICIHIWQVAQQWQVLAPAPTAAVRHGIVTRALATRIVEGQTGIWTRQPGVDHKDLRPKSRRLKMNQNEWDDDDDYDMMITIII